MRGYCECGCGQKTKIAPKSCTAKGWVKGEPRKFIQGHHMHLQTGKNHPRWNGGRIVVKSRGKQYVMVLCPNHPRNEGRSDSLSRYVFEHILVVEKALGKILRFTAVVHHVDENGLNNQNPNLVACHDDAYHKILEKRAKAYKAWREEKNV